MTPRKAHNVFVNCLDTDPRREEAAARLLLLIEQHELAVAWHKEQCELLTIGPPGPLDLERLHKALTAGDPPDTEQGEV